MKALDAFIENVTSKYIFFQPCVDIEGNDLYFCTCGHSIKTKGDNGKYVFSVEDVDNWDLSDLNHGYKKIAIVCPNCNKDYEKPENYTNIQPINVKFLERFHIEETDSYIALYKFRIDSEFKKKEENFDIKAEYAYLKVNKSSKRISFKNFNKNAITVHLENLLKSIDLFFQSESSVIQVENFIYVHHFISWLAKQIRDAKNMNLIDELFNKMIGDSGILILKEIISIFLGILCYPNLSTISLTKGNQFLYDLMNHCHLPSVKFLAQENATTPLKIFNTLISLKNNELQSKLDADDTSKLGYLFKSKSGSNVLIHYDANEVNSIKTQKIIKDGAKVFVRDNINNKKISPYIFNKIKTFQEYETIIRWLKFISYENLITLVMQYDIDFLNAVFHRIEFRDDINFSRTKQFILLILDQIETIQKKENEQITLNNVDEMQDYINYVNGINMPAKKETSKNSIFDIVKQFDFTLFDDCLRMIHELKWEPSKVLYKVKTMKKLSELHNNLVKHRSYLTTDQVNEKFIEFSNKFKYLEVYSSSLEIKIISTPRELIDAAVEMHNCAGSFVSRVANEEYVSFIVYDNSPFREKNEYHKYMMVLEVTKLGLELVGIKSYCNTYGNDRFKLDMMEYLIEKDISFKDVPSIKLSVKSVEQSYNGTFENVESNLVEYNEQIAKKLNKNS